jgi:hypothetical protein
MIAMQARASDEQQYTPLQLIPDTRKDLFCSKRPLQDQPMRRV